MRHEHSIHLTQASVCTLCHSACVFMNAIDQCMSVVCCGCCSSLFLQQLKPVLGIVRWTVSSINGLTVVCEKHQVLQTKQTHTCINRSPLTTRISRLKRRKQCRCFQCSDPVTNSGDDGVQVLDFAFQHHHPVTLSALLVWMVQHHVEKVTELGRDASVLER